MTKQRGYRVSDLAHEILCDEAQKRGLTNSECLELLLLCRKYPAKKAAAMAKEGRVVGRPKRAARVKQ